MYKTKHEIRMQEPASKNSRKGNKTLGMASNTWKLRQNSSFKFRIKLCILQLFWTWALGLWWSCGFCLGMSIFCHVFWSSSQRFVLFVVLSAGNSSPESLFKNAEDGNNASKAICLRYVARRTGTLSRVWASVDLYCGSPFCDTLGPMLGTEALHSIAVEAVMLSQVSLAPWLRRYHGFSCVKVPTKAVHASVVWVGTLSDLSKYKYSMHCNSFPGALWTGTVS